MKTTNHTPGPWNLNVDSVHIREGVTVQPVAHHMEAQGIADARLISAAPDLLHALNLLLDKLNAHGIKNKHLFDAIEKAESAISKAKGYK